MSRRLVALFVVACLAALAAAPARADFGLKELDLTFENADGSVAAQAGAHPFSMITTIGFNTKPNEALGFEVPDENPKDIVVVQAPGFVGDPNVVTPCTTAAFALEECPAGSQVGVVDVEYQEPGFTEGAEAVYSLAPAPGVAMSLGWHVSAANIPVTIDIRVSESPRHNIVASLTNIPNVVPIYNSKLTLWGVPAASAHDSERSGVGCSAGCSVSIEERPFLTTPRSCTGPLATSFSATSWEGSTFAETIFTHDDAEPPNQLGMVGCGKLGFDPSLAAQPSSKAASSPTGMDVSLRVEDEGLTDPEGVAQSDIREVVVTLPEGMTANPSVAAGLEGCTEAQLERETPSSAPGAGCTQASKLGTVEVETPLLDETLNGVLYQAMPYENLADDSLIALYVVIKSEELGIVIKQPLRVEADPQTGRLTGVAEEIPQFPFSRFKVHFREGERSPLVTPSSCGTHTVEAKFVPWSGGAARTATSSFEVTTGPDGEACRGAGAARFGPGFEAGSTNNQAGSYSPFYMRLTRKDGEQELTRLDAVLPSGLVGKIAGLAECPQAAVEAAKAKSGEGELAAPSCPEASKIGRTSSGAGAGSALTYVEGALYLGGPYNGRPLSIVAIVPAVAGPFDLGTVVIQEGLTLNPSTAQVEVDGSASDPIPYILEGIPLRLRDLRVYADRSGFTINPTSCETMTATATAFGSFTDVLSAADDAPAALSSRFQAANCASLGFNPKLQLQLKGPTKRNRHAALRSTVTFPYESGPGYANIGRAVVTLPPSQFIDNERVNNPCTRVQFNAEACPDGSILGRARATTPLLDEPLEGFVYFRANGGERDLPDIVADLRGQFRVILVGFVDTATPKTNPRIRTTFAQVPDAAVTKFTLNLYGGERGLLVNSSNLCAKKQRGKLAFTGQNGRKRSSKPVVRTDCGTKKQKKAARRGHSRRSR